MLTPSDSLQLDEIWSMSLTRIREDNDYPDTIMKLWFEDLKLTILTEDTAVFVKARNEKGMIKPALHI